MQRLTNNDIDALEAALAKAPPGEARLLPNGGIDTDQDASYWGVLGGAGYYGGPGSGGFNLIGFIDEVEARRIVLSYNALPALLAELRELRRLTTPEPISEKHRDGNWWLVWALGAEQWMKCRWLGEYWGKSGTMREQLFDDLTHALPLPGRPEPAAARGQE
jgi:hypothetical protein